jgi:lysophospholipid acyltransferase (LPLAT)-like uncharacterized protein
VARALLGTLLGVLAQLWVWTLRVKVHAHPSLDLTDRRPWVFAFRHGAQFPLLAWRRRRTTVVLVSLSRDGALQARALVVHGLRVVRGSSSRGAAAGLAALIREVRARRCDAAFAVDGPRGPYSVAKPGAVIAAKATGGVIVPAVGVVRRGLRLSGTWDRFVLAWPFSRVDLLFGAPIDPAAAVDARADLQRALDTMSATAAEAPGPRATGDF